MGGKEERSMICKVGLLVDLSYAFAIHGFLLTVHYSPLELYKYIHMPDPIPKNICLVR